MKHLFLSLLPEQVRSVLADIPFDEDRMVDFANTTDTAWQAWRMENSESTSSSLGFRGFANCGKSCELCPFAKKCNSYKIHRIENTINYRISCGSTKCVYQILCQKSKCADFMYFGEDSGSLRKRFIKHKSDIFNDKRDQVSEHFNMPGHSLFDLRLIGLKHIPDDDHRKQRVAKCYTLKDENRKKSRILKKKKEKRRLERRREEEEGKPKRAITVKTQNRAKTLWVSGLQWN